MKIFIKTGGSDFQEIEKHISGTEFDLKYNRHFQRAKSSQQEENFRVPVRCEHGKGGWPGRMSGPAWPTGSLFFFKLVF